MDLPLGWIELNDGPDRTPMHLKVVVSLSFDGRRWQAQHGEYVAWRANPVDAETEVTEMVRGDMQAQLDANAGRAMQRYTRSETSRRN